MLDMEIVKGFSFFLDMPQMYLSEIAQVSNVSEFNLNEIIFKDGEDATALYGVVDGEVELSLIVKDKIIKTDVQYEESVRTSIEIIEKDIIVDSIFPGEVFGWSAFINPRIFTTNAKCSKSAKIISIPADKIKAIFDKEPQVGYVFMERLAEIIAHRLRNRTEKLVETWSEAFDVNIV